MPRQTICSHHHLSRILTWIKMQLVLTYSPTESYNPVTGLIQVINCLMWVNNKNIIRWCIIYAWNTKQGHAWPSESHVKLTDHVVQFLIIWCKQWQFWTCSNFRACMTWAVPILPLHRGWQECDCVPNHACNGLLWVIKGLAGICGGTNADDH